MASSLRLKVVDDGGGGGGGGEKVGVYVTLSAEKNGLISLRCCRTLCAAVIPNLRSGYIYLGIEFIY